ncbi:MAG: hypothetical protein BWY63_02301 [Chloroflexi bacterium ADurb.Bin360]|nr:MAG: hypothetical protein BWY63_02301 [Chloroflexi bacterium ADurb.Bin360]
MPKLIRYAPIALVILLVVAVPAVAGEGMAGIDFRIFTAVVAEFLAPYSVPEFRYLPASLFLVTPFALLPETVGFFAWNVLQLLSLLGGLWLIAPNLRAVLAALILVSPFAGILIYFGQFDGLLVLALGLGYFGVKANDPVRVGLAIALFTLKPVHVILPSVVLLLLLPSWRLRARAVLIPLALFALSFLIWPTWLPDWIAVAPYARQTHFLVTKVATIPWRVTGLIRSLLACGCAIYLVAFRRHPATLLSTALLVNLLLVTYFNPYSVVLAAPLIATVVDQLAGAGRAASHHLCG